MRLEQTQNKIAAGESEAFIYPRSTRPLRTPILYVHGREGSDPGGMAWMNISSRWPVITEVCRKSPMLCPHLGGNATWGNPTTQARMDASFSYAQTLPGVATGSVNLLAQSMGALAAIAWARVNKSKIGKIVLIIPVINLKDVRDNSSSQTEIDSAYGGTYSDANFGAAHNPLLIAQSGALAGLPIQLWYGTEDTLCKPEFAQQFATAVGSSCVLKPLNGGHAETTVGSVDPQQVSQFME